MRFYIRTLGCKVNAYDAQLITETLIKNGYIFTDKPEEADIFLVNTCAVTETASKKSLAALKRAKKSSSGVTVAVGCLAEIEPGALRGSCDVIIGAKCVSRITDILGAYKNAKPPAAAANTQITRFDGHTRAYVKIQDGCSDNCAYCAVPLARGRPRSRAPGECAAECKTLAQNGYKEIVISGINISLYGKDFKNGGAALGRLIRDIQTIDGIERIRFSSVSPNLITDGFLEEVSRCGKVCPHFHLSLQSGCDKTLSNMGRRYDTSLYESAVLKIRRLYPAASVSTDIIAGFPGETEDDFAQSLAFAEKQRFAKIHVFPFSPKRGTRAFLMQGQIASCEKRRRAQMLLALSKAMRESFLNDNIGRVMPVLVEKRENGFSCGYSDNYIWVKIARDCAPNTVQTVTAARHMMK